jgi:RNA polymerase sigma factor (sigma-70 family)
VKEPIIQQLIEQGYPLTAKYYYGCRGLASKLAFKYAKTSQEEDFILVALATATRMEPKFNPDSGASFYTYLNKIIKNDIQKEFGNPNRHTNKYKIIQRFIDDFGRAHGKYPDVQEISKGTSLSRFDILSIYYDRYKEQSLDTSLDPANMSDPFQNTDHQWVTEHLDVLDEQARYLMNSLYTYELSLSDAASALGISLEDARSIKNESLARLKDSIKKYQ